MKLRSIFCIVVILMFTLSCSSNSSNSKISEQKVTEMIADQETVYVDVRIPEEFAAETVKGAVNIALDQKENNLDFFKDKKNVVLFCNSGRQSGLALEILEKNGIYNAYNGTNVKRVNQLQNGK